MISYEEDSKPHIQWDHVDGPLLVCHDGTLHWLNAWERLFVKAGITSIETLDRQYNSEPQQGSD